MRRKEGLRLRPEGPRRLTAGGRQRRALGRAAHAGAEKQQLASGRQRPNPGRGRTPGGAAPRERLAHPSAAGKSGAEGTVMLCTSHVEAAGTLIMNLMDFGGQKPGGGGLGVSDLRGVLLRDEGQLHAVQTPKATDLAWVDLRNGKTSAGGTASAGSRASGPRGL